MAVHVARAEPGVVAGTAPLTMPVGASTAMLARAIFDTGIPRRTNAVYGTAKRKLTLVACALDTMLGGSSTAIQVQRSCCTNHQVPASCPAVNNPVSLTVTAKNILDDGSGGATRRSFITVRGAEMMRRIRQYTAACRPLWVAPTHMVVASAINPPVNGLTLTQIPMCGMTSD